MLKLTYCLTRRRGMSRAEFQKYWRETHAPLVAKAAAALGIRRYVQMHSGESPLEKPDEARPGMAAEDYDGVAELWFDSETAVLASLTSEEGRRHGAILAEDEARFIDFAKSFMVFGREHVIVGPPPTN